MSDVQRLPRNRLDAITDNETKVLRAMYRNKAHTPGGSRIRHYRQIWIDAIDDSHEPSGLDPELLRATVYSLYNKRLLNCAYGQFVVLTSEGLTFAKFLGPLDQSNDPATANQTPTEADP